MKAKNLYLVANYFARPRDPSRTREAGYMKNHDNISYDESINITKGLKNRDLDAKVILDLTNQSVFKNSFNNNRDFASLLAYYQENYPKYVNPVLALLYKDQIDVTHVHSQEEKEGAGS